MMRNLTEGVALVLTSRKLRELFVKDPEACAREINISPRSFDLFIKLCPLELGRQSEILIRKRFHETKFHLPRFLRKREGLYSLFLDYSEGYWPRGHRRQTTDARRFALWCLLHFGRTMRSRSPHRHPVTQQ